MGACPARIQHETETIPGSGEPGRIGHWQARTTLSAAEKLAPELSWKTVNLLFKAAAYEGLMH